ncbi:Transcription factor-like protein [Hapsidospora chrysogenum ATCC 11550]|uniref:Transcription factor-like protein n=1 Tax=Hapsidospora chrysogenum (strain ATCC 11550 / CBS 779.69 / DSM 880 / IAM 14645 / JCM 23072 / IMI 49137) TaxID=857340 RepID=A0A086T241_HAPC1|nr:Transcription factor-like protein [Hapsidospora chrysogenum ATCC 11550]
MASSSAAGEPMDVAPGSDTSAGGVNKSSQPSAGMPSQAADAEAEGKAADKVADKAADQSKNPSPPDTGNSASNTNNNPGSMPAPPPAAAALHQPKIVQTAFIHKLYNMLEDQNIQHLISWSSSADSFVMAPTPDFSKVLSQYFKHTNISSFVRQLNMYGFHKERDVFHTGNPESTLWEFKHGAGNFKRGDLVGLREIKRRASRHALVHRENNYVKHAPSQPGAPAEPGPMTSDSTDRLANLEHSIYDLSARLQRSEENAQWKHQAAMETMNRLLHFNQELARVVLSVAPPDSAAHRDVVTLQGEMQRQADLVRSIDEGPEHPYARQQYFGTVENAPVSPRQIPQDDSRRGNLAVPPRQNFYRPPVPSNLSSVPTRRPYGSISAGGTTQSSPSRHANPAAAPGPHPLSNVEPHPGSLVGRRHTSGDLRAHGWHPSLSNFPSHAPAAYPPSPSRAPPDDQRTRETLQTYSLGTTVSQHPSSRPSTPPPFASNPSNGTGEAPFGNWSWGSAASRGLKDSSAPPTRRGSMAHILNPSDTAERSDEDENPRGDEDRKRKRM